MSKSKGNAGERELCRILADTFAGSFIRVPNSGAFTGGKNASRMATMSAGQVRASKGDIIPPDHMPRLVIEAKFYKDFRFHQLLSACPQLDAWLEQAAVSAGPDDLSLVCFKINRVGWYVALPTNPAFTLGSHATYQTTTGQYLVAPLGDFLARNQAEVLRLSQPSP
ncbi:hypothetical protein [Caulobacter sp. FWC2]|uniref:putative PDDEXK endonuclease n=1 Tax=Caulobacter sp. FWC2 TaxID=69664 RepID=UPI000C15480C|nr:hypothetical protein [Caulobacter sp. FWC2]PIB91009.1 hypothetical protein CSW62_05140 [Caulobacter sp. FWC2]